MNKVAFSGMIIALASVLSYVSMIIPFKMPQGGSVSILSMFLIHFISIKYDSKTGIVSGVVYGLLQYIISPYFFTPVQFLLDYVVAYGVLGIVISFGDKRTWANIQISYVFSAILRLIAHTISGVVFFSEYAPAGQSPIMYSLIYNASYIVVEVILTLFIINIKPMKNVFAQQLYSKNN